jgi:bacteriorhodopsin
MSDRRWTDPSQPQTLQGAVVLSYMLAGLALLYTVLFRAAPSIILIVLGVAAYFIANERRWAYYLASATAVVYLVLQVIGWLSFSRSLSGLLTVLFAGVLLALLLHRQSRAYQKIYFH